MGECKSNYPFLPSFPSFLPPQSSPPVPPPVPLTGGDRTHSFHGQVRVWGIARPCCLRSRKALAVEGCQREMARHVVIRMQGPNRTTRRPKLSLDVNNNSLLFFQDFSGIRIIPNFLEITLITSTTRPQTVRLPRWAISTCRPVVLWDGGEPSSITRTWVRLLQVPAHDCYTTYDTVLPRLAAG